MSLFSAIDPNDVLALTLEVEPVTGDGLKIAFVGFQKTMLLTQAQDPGLFLISDMGSALLLRHQFILPLHLRTEEFHHRKDEEHIDHHLHDPGKALPHIRVGFCPPSVETEGEFHVIFKFRVTHGFD